MKAAKIGLWTGWVLVTLGGIAQPIPHMHIVSALGYSLGQIMLLFSGLAYAAGSLKRGNTLPMKFTATIIIYLIAFPSLVALIATSGQVQFITGHGSGWQFWLFTQLRAFLVQSVLALTILLPHYLKGRLKWEDASEQAKTLVPSWSAALAAVATGGQVIMLHYYKGPLVHTSLSTVIVAALAVATLLAPAYKWLTKAVWISGLSDILSPRSWHKSISEVIGEIMRSSESLRQGSNSPNHVDRCNCLICKWHRRRCAICREAGMIAIDSETNTGGPITGSEQVAREERDDRAPLAGRPDGPPAVDPEEAMKRFDADSQAVCEGHPS